MQRLFVGPASGLLNAVLLFSVPLWICRRSPIFTLGVSDTRSLMLAFPKFIEFCASMYLATSTISVLLAGYVTIPLTMFRALKSVQQRTVWFATRR